MFATRQVSPHSGYSLICAAIFRASKSVALPITTTPFRCRQMIPSSAMPIQTISGPFIGQPQKTSLAQRLATRLYHATRQLETPAIANQPVDASGSTNSTITLVCISDTHNTKPSPLPPGDILLHAGDLSQFGTFAEIQAQLSWLAAHPHPHKVIIAGNHDLLLDSAFVAAHPDRELGRHEGRRRSDLDWGGIHYLEHGSIDLVVPGKGRSISVFGSPWTPRCGSWAFQYGDGEGQGPGALPASADVVLVHGPPKGHLDDGGKGCEMLLAEVKRAKPKLVVCGHIHAGRGEEWLLFDRVEEWYEAVVLGRRRWVSVVSLALCFLWRTATRAMRPAPSYGQTRGTHLVNAAMVGGRGNREHRDAIVVVM